MSNSTTERTYFPWTQPSGENRSELKVNNSLTGSLTPFVLRPGTNQVKWYICGPTVYDSSHVGHASNYVRFDVVRRILTEYFGYDVTVQMNITDIDDKIIKKANERNVEFTVISQNYEREFLDDMRALNVRPADHVTRVSEFIPETVEYIEKIIDNGFAYESDSSVYFNVSAFTGAGYNYAKTAPWSVGNKEKLAEGEGSLADGVGKKNNNDFALWKKSKANEPWWDSPWGRGRPGWHIECSAMAHSVLGERIDVHAGGVDLRFPHHANEIAQAEAHQCCHQWVNYFLHSGHLHIDGLKMSKSLKNFITIRSCLTRYNARQLRLLFLGHKYDAPMDYAESSMEEAVSLDRVITDFFGSLKARMRELQKRDETIAPTRPGSKANTLMANLHKTQEEVHRALSNNFDTPRAMIEIKALIRSTNAYMNSDESGNFCVLESVGSYLTRIFVIFGLTPSASVTYGGDNDGTGSQSREEAVAPILDIFASFREEVRSIVRSRAEDSTEQLLRLCDRVRDQSLPPHGVRLEDSGGKAVWKLEDPETLMLEIRRKKEDEEARRLKKEELNKQRRQKELEELLAGKLAPNLLFKEGAEFRSKYMEYDNEGLPTVDNMGKPVSKSASKALNKRLTKQKKLHEKYNKAVAEGRICDV